MKGTEFLHLGSTSLLTIIYLMGLYSNTFDYDTIHNIFINLGFPTYLIKPLGIAEFLGLMAIWLKNYRSVTEWAYAGFFFNLLIACSAHIVVGDSQYPMALSGLVLLIISYSTWRRISNTTDKGDINEIKKV